MAICKNCGKEISDTAKVCRFCGTRVDGAVSKAAAPEEKSATRTCPNCGNQVSPEAKVCRFCGTALPRIDWESAINARNETVFQANRQISPDMSTQYEFVNDCVTWNLLPGQIAARFTGNDLDSFANVKGLIVQEGTVALFFDQGEFVGVLEPGKHLFQESKAKKSDGDDSNKKGSNFLSNIGSGLKRTFTKIKLGQLFSNKPKADSDQTVSKKRTFEVSVVLIRDSEFPLLFEFDNISTRNLKSTVGLHLVGEINDFEQFYNGQLQEKKFVCYDSFSRIIEPAVRAITNRVLSTVSPQEVENNAELQYELLSALQQEVQALYPYIDISKIVSISANREELERINKLKEELYVAEEELAQVQARYDFQNRLQDSEYQQQLKEARSKVDFEALLDKIDQDHMINADKKDEFIMLLKAEKVIREARSKDKVDSTLHEFEKSGLLRSEEIDVLKKEIEHRSQLSEIKNLAALDEERLNWEISVGNRRMENELNRRRMQDDYDDKRRQTDFDFETQERNQQMEMLRQMQGLKLEKEDAEHHRDMEIRNFNSLQEKEGNRHKEEMRRLFQGMSAEQIMAANPDITPAAAQAMAEKFKAEVANNSKEEIKETILNQQAMNMQLIQQMMQTMQGMSANQVNAKQAELDRVYADSEKYQDRFTSGMNNAISSVSNAFKIPEKANINVNKKVEEVIACPECGAKIPVGSAFCDQCGHKF